MHDSAARIEDAARLDAVGVDIRARVNLERLPVVVRPRLTRRVVGLLQSGASVLLRGPSGVGKTALVHSLVRAHWPVAQFGQLRLLDAQGTTAPSILEVTAARLLAGTFFVAELENKCERFFGTARAKPAILFLDNTHTFVGAGASMNDPQGDAANLLVPHMERGLQVIGAVTPEGEAVLRARNQSLHARFVVVDVPPPDDTETAVIIAKHVEALGRKGRVVSPALIPVALELARRHMPGEYPHAASLRLLHRAVAEDEHATERRLREAVAEELGVRAHFVGVGDPPTHRAIRGALAARVFGQDAAVDEVADALVRFGSGLTEPGRPLAAFLFAGPTGCGKTSLALETARTLSGEDALLRFDMSEYASPDGFDRLIGAGPDSLTSRAAAAKSGVLLLDEVEKAHPAVLRLLLQVLGEARLTDEAGRTVRFDSFIVVLTTNVGGRRWALARSEEKAVRGVLADCSDEFPPELLGRLTRIVVFRPLGHSAACSVIERELERLNELPGIVDRRLQLMWGEALARALATHGVSPQRGARGIESVVRTLVATPLARWLSEHPEAVDGPVMVAPRTDAQGDMVSLAIDWVDGAGFFAGLAN